MTAEDATTAATVAAEIARGITDAVRVNARILARQRGEEATAAAALEPVYRWLVDDLAFPFDMHTDHKPAWLDVERLAAMWDASDGEPPGTYLDVIYDETGWPRP